MPPLQSGFRRNLSSSNQLMQLFDIHLSKDDIVIAKRRRG